VPVSYIHRNALLHHNHCRTIPHHRYRPPPQNTTPNIPQKKATQATLPMLIKAAMGEA
jgi:hypothetical protein